MRNNQRGFTLVEAVMAITVFALGIVSVASLGSIAKSTSDLGKDTVVASNYLQEGLEAMRSLRDASWSNVGTDGNYRLVSQGASYPAWQLSSGTEAVDKFTRTVQIASVSREDTDSSGTITSGDKMVPNGGVFNDPDTKKITVTLTWKSGSRTVTKTLTEYLTNWQT